MPIPTITAVECGQCGKDSDSPRPVVAGNIVCSRCLELCFQRCADCNTHRESITTTAEGREVCETCRASYDVCGRCDRYTRTTYATIDNATVCRDCATSHYTKCDECDRYAPHTDRNDDGQDICQDCAAHHYWSCRDCYDVLISTGDYCSECSDANETCDLIEDYSYRPDPRFHGDGPLFVGMELEVSIPSGCLRDAASIADDHLGTLAYLKEDTSIAGKGFEIVTHPMSYEWAMERFPWGLLDALSGMGADADNNGLHVHVSRAAFSGPCHVYRWMKFFYRNQPQVVALARRATDEWAAFGSYGRSHIKCYAKGEKGLRYQAINTQNEETLELRVFAGTLNRQQAQAAVGLAVASVQYTRTLTTTDITQRGGWEWSAFAAWVAARPQYAPLLAEMENLTCAC